jgi:two-component system sensor histidine kinase/response regulator
VDDDDRMTVIRVEVTDSGVGIPPDKLKVIFQPFVQADTSTSRTYGGSGLGLAISAQLVTLMGGDLGAISRVGGGSTFWFTVRVHTSTQAPESLRSPDAELTGLTALIVDDNAASREVLSEGLTGWGMTVTTADSGPSALTALRTVAGLGRAFAVAVVDRFMPGMDGLELADAIVKDHTPAPRLLLMTGFGDELGSSEVSGVTAILFKPIHQEDLHACLRAALGPQSATASTGATPPGSPLTRKRAEGRLLLVEDNPINQKVAVAMLSGAGYQVETAVNGTAAVQAVASGTYDVILMDCQMPEMDGYEATAAIRAQEWPHRRTPIIAMTAGARREDRERCLAAGMDAYLSKPVSKDALLALVARSLKNKVALGAATR